MREVQLYIEGQRVDLFKDETISVTQSIQNVKDIVKVFTDFSKNINTETFDLLQARSLHKTLFYSLCMSSNAISEIFPNGQLKYLTLFCCYIAYLM